ncbi:very-long-chain aldehyde decarbonylase GL1-10-like [Hordeum vulgare subsp. vulgare]|nr:very-long-chain aldehyde decarbonylase GL1-10-like [Hordeum vulgare subsp. vulgare]
MLPYATGAEAEEALGRTLTYAEAAWLRYSASVPDRWLHLHSVAMTMVVYTLAPLPLALLELRTPAAAAPYKLQPRARHSLAVFLRCYVESVRVLLLLGPCLLVSYTDTKIMEMPTGLPLPSMGEVAAQLAVYFLVEDYINYWIHRLLHTKWCYDKIHSVHHEFTAPMGYAVWYDHWAEKLLLSVASLAGPAIVPCHITTLWLWFVARLLVGINIHSGFKLPFGLAKFIPFYGGAEQHDYHHYVGGQSQSNFAPVFTYCDYIYGTDKGYRYHKATQAKVTSVSHLLKMGQRFDDDDGF